MQELKMPLWREFLRLSTELHDTGEIQAIDATGIDRVAAYQHYAKRTDNTFRAVRMTDLIDCSTDSILDIHCSMKQPHATQTVWQLLTRNLEDVNVLTANKGYDRELLRSEGIKPVINHREFRRHGVVNT